MTRSTSLRTLLFATMVAGVTTVGAQPSTFRITQVYSTLDGAVQYVELTESAGLNGQHRLAGLTLTSEHNGVVKRFMFTEDLPTDQTAYRSIIVSNTSLTLIFGSIGSLFAPVFFEYTPDVKWLPTRFLPTDGGTLDFAGVDQMKYAALPNDGATALYRDGAARQATVPDHARGQRNNVFHSWVYAVEYYHAATDRYFISASAPDIEALDSGRLPGWSRTDESLSVGASPITSPYLRQPVCRFHIPPGEGDSHFLSAS
ncbi:MAG TPA: hypothetical protein VNE58_12765, partial [Casimicrobiaceae bacterium]|nr:hypothetical protein [Casimicrobiaceae bacterium]